ncbi:histidine decarboxylase isoform X4 [Nasonia vitripennis]|uniref:Histidine decarboxylase n=1 Tax=Nasonia vitripennis TaxID=7425 RepID=A0A7M7QL52_NASVI|nr:histidine decarboxylase isoform X4 [Nasonia vitripennis]XP_032456309.1 histidine decarboxylase isoform X4 [Nasonia vitripennis]
MNLEEYRQHGKEMVDYIADYLENIRKRRVYPSVSPGYLRNILPQSAPVDGEPWADIFDDIEKCIMPGVTHWQSPHMHAYFPALNSPASLLADMLADAINCLGFTWASSPVCTELETIVMNWLGKMIDLPDDFLHQADGSGGGVIQTTASESTLVCLLAARTRAIRDVQENDPDLLPAEINSRLVAYCSDQAHSSVEKAGLIGLVRMRYIDSDDNLSMRGEKLAEALQRDREEGLVPFFVCATLGTTGACSFDNVQEIGPICERNGLWLHVDAAYAGSAFVCPEFRSWMKGIEYADSFAFNPSKWLMVHFDCTAMWVRNSQSLHRTFNVEPIYLQHENSGLAIDYMHWQIPLSKKFRALKLWFVIRNYGITGLQKHIREGVRLAQKFEALVLADSRFEIPAARHLGMVVFRLRGENSLTERLLKKMNSRGRVHCVPAALHGKYVIRFTVTSTNTTNEDILRDWAEIKSTATEILGSGTSSPSRARVSLAAMRRRIRGILMSGKQFSLDSRMDLVQGYASCARPLSEPCANLLQVKEDEDYVGKSDSTLSIDKSESTIGDSCASLENHLGSQDSDGKIVNGSTYDKFQRFKESEEDEEVENSLVDIGNSVIKTGISKSETIGAINSCFSNVIADGGTLTMTRLNSENLMESAELCRKCGHYVKQQ